MIGSKRVLLAAALMGAALISFATEAQAWRRGSLRNRGSAVQQKPKITWGTDYQEAMQKAKAQRKMLLVYFRAEGSDAIKNEFENSLRDDKLFDPLSKLVLVYLPLDAKIGGDDEAWQDKRLLDHPAFAELHGQPGMAMIDLANKDQEYYSHVVSALPLAQGKYYRYQPSHLSVLLNLPAGTLTQRTMVFAVRIHPERPASTGGETLTVLTTEAQSHSNYQAQIGVQGHHHWDHRFSRLRRLLPRGLGAREVCAESWPNEGMVDAAVDCVDCWRQSSGHWSAVSAPQPTFGYDMRRGSNGIWYATGVFGTHDY